MPQRGFLKEGKQLSISPAAITGPHRNNAHSATNSSLHDDKIVGNVKLRKLQVNHPQYTITDYHSSRSEASQSPSPITTGSPKRSADARKSSSLPASARNMAVKLDGYSSNDDDGKKVVVGILKRDKENQAPRGSVGDIFESETLLAGRDQGNSNPRNHQSNRFNHQRAYHSQGDCNRDSQNPAHTNFSQGCAVKPHPSSQYRPRPSSQYRNAEDVSHSQKSQSHFPNSYTHHQIPSAIKHAQRDGSHATMAQEWPRPLLAKVGKMHLKASASISERRMLPNWPRYSSKPTPTTWSKHDHSHTHTSPGFR